MLVRDHPREDITSVAGESDMQKGTHLLTALTLAASMTVAACGNGRDKTTSSAGGEVYNTPSTTATGSAASPSSVPAADTARMEKHHSKLAGAAAGAAAGHMLGGHAVLGAAAGALVQHERNKHR
jgi:predicted small secreted protein